jgi:hypothetical protein
MPPVGYRNLSLTHDANDAMLRLQDAIAGITGLSLTRSQVIQVTELLIANAIDEQRGEVAYRALRALMQLGI